MSDSAARPPEEEILRVFQREGGSPPGRDATPAVGTRGEPGSYRRAVEGAAVSLARRAFGDARWSYLYDKGTGYASRDGADGDVAAAARRVRGGPELTGPVLGPVIKPAVWTWEVPLYFWFGGIAAGSSFVALACDAAGDRRSAAVARKLVLAAALPSAPLLILDLGRPERFLNMMRIFKLRSPMSVGAWCLTGFSSTAAVAVAAELVGRERIARAADAATAAQGTVLGSYTGVLLASTAVPVWARSRALLPAIFVCTAVGTGAAANRLALAASGVPAGHPTRDALGHLETVAMATELALSAINERRLGHLSDALEEGRPGRLLARAKQGVWAGLLLRLARRRGGPWVDHLASTTFLAAGLAFRFAWVGAGRSSAADDEAVARAARSSSR